MQNKKVLIVANDFTTIHHFRMELLDSLQVRGYQVTVALPEDDRNRCFTEVGCQVQTIPMSRFGTNPLADMKTMLSIRRVIRQLHPVAVLTYTAKANIYGSMAAALERVPCICTVTGLGINFAKGNFVSKIMLMLHKFGLRKAQRVFFQNESNRDYFVRNGIARRNGQIIPGSGVNLEQNAFATYPDNRPIQFISVARIRQDKGYDELFDAVRRCREAGIAAQFHVVGWYEDERYHPVVEKMRKEYGVLFYDYVPHQQMHSLIAKCDCLIQPSHHEGMSNVILEAAASGRPCIVSDISGCREGIRDGETGFLFRVKDSEDLYAKIHTFVALPRERRAEMGKHARQYMESHFDRQLVIQHYVKEIEIAMQR